MQNHFGISEVTEFWDRVADEYDAVNDRIGSAHEQRFSEAIKHLDVKPGVKILNIWSRTGKAVAYLKEAGIENIYNLEASPRMLEKARLRHPGSHFELTDLAYLKFPDNYFDRILSLETLEHVPDPSLFLGELFRVLKPDGRLVMSLPPQTAELPLRLYDFFFKNHGEGPHRFLSSKTVRRLLKEAGFNLTLHKGTLLIPVGPEWLKSFGESIINFLQNTPVRELGIRQFYVCKK
jgi:ubiquinone/menaquinone biosynthesis C-methylase UbiE